MRLSRPDYLTVKLTQENDMLLTGVFVFAIQRWIVRLQHIESVANGMSEVCL